MERQLSSQSEAPHHHSCEVEPQRVECRSREEEPQSVERRSPEVDPQHVERRSPEVELRRPERRSPEGELRRPERRSPETELRRLHRRSSGAEARRTHSLVRQACINRARISLEPRAESYCGDGARSERPGSGEPARFDPHRSQPPAAQRRHVRPATADSNFERLLNGISGGSGSGLRRSCSVPRSLGHLTALNSSTATSRPDSAATRRADGSATYRSHFLLRRDQGLLLQPAQAAIQRIRSRHLDALLDAAAPVTSPLTSSAWCRRSRDTLLGPGEGGVRLKSMVRSTDAEFLRDTRGSRNKARPTSLEAMEPQKARLGSSQSLDESEAAFLET